MKKITLILTMFFLLLVSPLSVNAQEPLEAEKMTTIMNVRESGKMEVTQEIEMIFNQPHRGIFVTVPQRYDDVVINGKKQNFFMPVSNLKVLSGDPVEFNTNSKGIVMQIGNPEVYLEGKKTYTFSYDIQMYQWMESNTDILYMNLIGDNWDFPIHQNDFEITLPKDVENDVYFYASEDNRPVDFTVEGNVIKGSYMGTLNREALTVETTLGENYFNYPNTDFSTYVVVAQAVFTALLIVIYLRHGKDYHVVDSVEFTAPDDLSSADVGYVYRGVVSNDDVISLIIYWASKGFLMIEELSKNEMELTKIKDMDETYPAEERRIFKALFATGDVANTKTLSNKFGVTLQNAKQAIPQSFSQDKNRRIFERTGLVFKYLLALILPIFAIALYMSFTYAKIPSIELALPQGIAALISSMIFIISGIYVFDNAKDSRHISLKIVYILAFVLINILIAMGVLFRNKGMIMLVKFIIHNLMFLVSIMLLANMSRRTTQGTRWYGQILGLRRFIKTAEKDRLEMLAEETPTIFYDILPFAFALGVTDVWSKKFRDIQIEQPDWYRTQGNVNFTSIYLWSSLNRSINTMRPAMTSVPAPTGKSGGGGSFGGGGFGGGGSSGGGFGGSGGGGW